MQKDFELETILSITTNINCTSNFSKVHELACFVFNDDFMTTIALEFCKDDLKEHILNIHPQLKNVTPPLIHYGIFLDNWLKQQKEEFGVFLPISEFNIPLVQNPQTSNNIQNNSIKSNYVKPSIKLQELEETTCETLEKDFFNQKGYVLKKIKKIKKK